MTTTGLILFGHGARDPQWAEPMRRVAASIKHEYPALTVELAFLEFLAPDLAQAVDMLALGCQRIVVVPFFIAQAGHVKRDVPLLLEQARDDHPGLSIELAAPIGESDKVLAAIVDYAVELAVGQSGGQ